MARSETLPIFLDTYKATLELYRAIGKFPREYKFSLGEEMRRDALSLLRLIFIANHMKNKAETIEQYLATVEMIRMQIRLTYDLRALPMQTMVNLNLLFDTVARQANAWVRHERSKFLLKNTKKES